MSQSGLVQLWFFCVLFRPVKLKSFKRIPVLIAIAVVAAVCVLQALRLDLFEQLEWKTFDWRARVAAHFPSPIATNLGFVFISDKSIAELNNGSLGYHYGLYWPRHIYGRLVRELSAQGAKAVAFDVLFAELRPDHAPVPVNAARNPDLAGWLARLHPGQSPAKVEDAVLVESDDFFAWQMMRASNVVLAAEKELLPPELFATNALCLGDISADKDSDGKLRRAKAFKEYRRWHPLFKMAEADPAFGVDLSRARAEPGRIILPRAGVEPITVPIDGEGNFELADFVGDKLPAGMAPKAKAFIDERVWHMGIVLAAQELQLDLATAQIDHAQGQITLRGADGVERIIPIDGQDYFYIDWNLASADGRLTKEPVEELLKQDQARSAGEIAGLTNRWRGKLVVVGSSATGNDLTDRGATPLEKDALLVSKHWNVANSVLTGRFVHRSKLPTELLLIIFLGTLTAIVTWQFRALSAACGVLALIGAYLGLGVWLYVQYRYWLPLVMPLFGAVLVEHVSLVTYRVVFEERERRRVKSIFAKLVSPNVVQELLGSERLSLGGAPREVTVMFSDVRGFTELTDRSREQAAEFVRGHGLSGGPAEARFEEQARETLKTVNLYLAVVADTVKKHEGTLDKYIGDCVKAFWGAPTPDQRHALHCVRAAIEAQRAIDALNRERLAENKRREPENAQRVAVGADPEPLLPILVLGTGINTGVATVGLMGSDAHILNYTVFGREVNLASRLEGLSGRGRILIGESTYQEILRDDPALAAQCAALPPATVKGIREAVNVYEMPWAVPNSNTAPV